MSKQKYPQTTTVSSTGTTTGRAGNRKENGYSSFFIHAKQAQKRKDAEARQANYDKLTIAEKFATLIEGGSVRQRAKLNKQLATAAGKRRSNYYSGYKACCQEEILKKELIITSFMLRQAQEIA